MSHLLKIFLLSRALTIVQEIHLAYKRACLDLEYLVYMGIVGFLLVESWYSIYTQSQDLPRLFFKDDSIFVMVLAIMSWHI